MARTAWEKKTWATKLFEAARLMIKRSGIIHRCGQLLLMLASVLAVWVKKKENHPQPRVCAFRPAQGDQLPIRPSRGLRESQHVNMVKRCQAMVVYNFRG